MGSFSFAIISTATNLVIPFRRYASCLSKEPVDRSLGSLVSIEVAGVDVEPYDVTRCSKFDGTPVMRRIMPSGFPSAV